ncbi:MAG: asparagine synthase (glutamine-hydrolyzing) [Clostridia bacterium]|nr:asparagine synthase (glutamine-hydrolyzing) [Clostridia bacterium]
MCSINGYIDFNDLKHSRQGEVLAAGRTLQHRGPDASGTHAFGGVCFCHNRLAVMDPQRGHQPMSVIFRRKRYTIVYNGEIYNSGELRRELRREGAVFLTDCDTETVLWAAIIWGEEAPSHLNGIFAFAVHNETDGTVFFARDRLGVKPFFYAQVGGKFYFASEVKALLYHPEIPPEIDEVGLWQLLFLTPVTLPRKSVFRHIRSLLPGYCATLSAEGFSEKPYWRLEARECRDDARTASDTVRALFTDAVTRQLGSDVPLAVLLSGGLDSSSITAIAERVLSAEGKVTHTYSFEYEGNQESFSATLFQPQGDDEFAKGLAEALGTSHTVLTAPTAAVAAGLFDAVCARDLPGQADIDSSLLWFCREIKKRHTVVLSGECSDEIFGGYPWFYRPEMLYRDFFPWLHDPLARVSLFDNGITKCDKGLEFLREVYRSTLAECPVVDGEKECDRVARQATWLSTRYFMANLLERKDRMSMRSAVEVRVPFADHRILEYVFNVPWDIKFENGVEKALLRRAMTGYLPDNVLWRKKSPYPKTHSKEYEILVRGMLRERLARGGFLAQALDKSRLNAMLEGENTTWFGQLMSRPQLIAWLCQLDFFFEKYRVKLV